MKKIVAIGLFIIICNFLGTSQEVNIHHITL